VGFNLMVGSSLLASAVFILSSPNLVEFREEYTADFNGHIPTSSHHCFSKSVNATIVNIPIF
jgi:hypothetical protein